MKKQENSNAAEYEKLKKETHKAIRELYKISDSKEREKAEKAVLKQLLKDRKRLGMEPPEPEFTREDAMYWANAVEKAANKSPEEELRGELIREEQNKSGAWMPWTAGILLITFVAYLGHLFFSWIESL